MTEQERFPCPSCGTTVSRGDIYCRRCGVSLIEYTNAEPEPPSLQPKTVTRVSYKRKFSLTQRFYKLFTSPSEAMNDIALAPDYSAVLAIIAVELVLLSVTSAMVLQRIRLFGPNSVSLSNFLPGFLVATILIAPSFVGTEVGDRVLNYEIRV